MGKNKKKGNKPPPSVGAAVKADLDNEPKFIELDDDVASRWGPRIVDFLQAVSDAVTAAS